MREDGQTLFAVGTDPHRSLRGGYENDRRALIYINLYSALLA
jgi:hypothetical protein